LGSGLWYSVNYERRIIDPLGVRAGISFISISGSNVAGSASASRWAFPISAEYLGFRSGRHGLELGLGVTLTYGTYGASNQIAGSGSASLFDAEGNCFVGYRYHPVNGAGFQFRIGAMLLVGRAYGGLLVGTLGSVGLLPFGYLSLGGAF
jgi:hypothetical protein